MRKKTFPIKYKTEDVYSLYLNEKNKLSTETEFKEFLERWRYIFPPNFKENFQFTLEEVKECSRVLEDQECCSTCPFSQDKNHCDIFDLVAPPNLIRTFILSQKYGVPQGAILIQIMKTLEEKESKNRIQQKLLNLKKIQPEIVKTRTDFIQKVNQLDREIQELIDRRFEEAFPKYIVKCFSSLDSGCLAPNWKPTIFFDRIEMGLTTYRSNELPPEIPIEKIVEILEFISKEIGIPYTIS